VSVATGAGDFLPPGTRRADEDLADDLGAGAAGVVAGVVLAVAPEEVSLLALRIVPQSAGKDQTVSGSAWWDHAGTELTSKHGEQTDDDRDRFASERSMRPAPPCERRPSL
jgi:hypothetical protein